MTILVFVLALWLPLVTLAKVTSAIILIVFALVNLTLLVIRIRESRTEEGVALGAKELLPVIGLLTCVAFLVFQGAAIC